MKTFNKHPQWHNEPIRLTQEQKQDPLLIFNDFFENYHLQEVRKELWNWMTAVISSPSSVSSDPNARSNHIFFYEKIEELVEGCFMIKKNADKLVKKKRCKKLKKPQRNDSK